MCCEICTEMEMGESDEGGERMREKERGRVSEGGQVGGRGGRKGMREIIEGGAGVKRVGEQRSRTC